MDMTADERKLLAMCKPRVVIQSSRGIFGVLRADPMQDVAARCEGNGWLRFIRDNEPLRSEYEITPKGRAALTSANQQNPT